MLFATFVDETAWFLPSGTLESFRADLGLTYTQAGTVLALAGPGALLGTVFAAMADRYSRRVISAAGAFAFALCMVAFAAGGSFVVLALASLAMGAAATAMCDAAEVALVDMVDEDELRPALARANLLGVFGDLAGPALVAGSAFLGFSWRSAFWVAAALLALYGVVLAVSPLPGPCRNGAGGDEEDDAESHGSFRAMLAVARDRRVWLLGAIGLLSGPFDETLLGFTIALLATERGASTGAATLVALVGLCGGFFAFTGLAKRYQAIPEHRLLIGSVVVMTIGVVGIAVLPWVPLVAAAALATNVGLSLAWLAVQHRTLVLRPGQVGTTKAVVSCIEFPDFLLPIAIGVVADRAGLVAAIGLYGLLGLGLLGLAVASARADHRRQVRAG